jgi:hypothetical protein
LKISQSVRLHVTLFKGLELVSVVLCISWGRDSVVGIETRYWLDRSGIKFRCGQDIPLPSRPALGPTQPTIQWVPGLLSWGKAAVAWLEPVTRG